MQRMSTAHTAPAAASPVARTGRRRRAWADRALRGEALRGGARRTGAWGRRPLRALVAAGALVTLAVQPVLAQSASLAPSPFGLVAPVWVAPTVPAELRIAGLVVLPGPDGLPGAVEVRFAGPFTPPAGRWRVSVGLGNPAGAWERLSMVWDGTQSTGLAERIEGLNVDNLGPLTASVDPTGAVVVSVPSGGLDAGGSDLVWAEAILGPDTEPTELVRTPWFPRAALVGEGAPGLLQGSTLGVPVPEDPGGLAPTSAPPVIDTGVPSVVESNGSALGVERGAAPAEVEGEAVSGAVDLVTLVGSTGDPDADAPPSGPQVRIDLLSGAIELGVGTVVGPLGPEVGGDTAPIGAGSWLRQPADGGADAPVEIDVAAAFAAVGGTDPQDALAVSVTRVLTGADGTVVVAPGVVGDGTWLGLGAAAETTTSAAGAAAGAADADTDADSGSPVVPVVVGVAAGVVAVGGAMALAGVRHRRRRPGPDDPLVGDDALLAEHARPEDTPLVPTEPRWGEVGAPDESAASVAPVAPVAAVEPSPSVAPGASPEHAVPVAPGVPVESPDPAESVAGDEVSVSAESSTPGVPAPPPVAGPPLSEAAPPPVPPPAAPVPGGADGSEPTALQGLDEDLDALSERLRRLSDGD